MSENYSPIRMNKTDYSDLVKPYEEEAYKALSDFVGINSILDEKTASKTAPFGQGVENALDYTAELGKALGFAVDRCDNYITELTYGQGDKVFDIYAHADTVPVNEKNWTKNPFALTRAGDVMYGRGTNDDKGPGIACLFAVKALMDKGKLGGYKLRFLFGGNEENGSLGLKHYFEVLKKGYPTLGISPDADYPLIYAEKSIYSYKASYSFHDDRLSSFFWGDALNIVLDEATAEIKESKDKVDALLSSYLKENEGLSGSFDGKKLFIKGVSAHGSLPWEGKNAGLHMLNFLGILWDIPLLRTIAKDYISGRGETFGGDFRDEYFDGCSYNVGAVSYDGSKLALSVNDRFPVSIKESQVLSAVKENTKADVVSLGGSDGFVFDPKSDLVQILLSSYQKETGDMDSRPFAIGGGTYARESKNSVAFGAAFPGRSMRMHGDDEFFPYSDFVANMAIYAHAIDRISEYLRTGKAIL